MHIYYLPRQRSISKRNPKAQGMGGVAWASWKVWMLWGLWLTHWMAWKQQSWRRGRRKKEKKKGGRESIQSTGHFWGAPATMCANEWHFQVCSYLLSISICSDVGKLPGLWINQKLRTFGWFLGLQNRISGSFISSSCEQNTLHEPFYSNDCAMMEAGDVTNIWSAVSTSLWIFLREELCCLPWPPAPIKSGPCYLAGLLPYHSPPHSPIPTYNGFSTPWT